MEAQLPLAKRPTLLLPMSIAPVAANAIATNRQVISWHQSLFPTGSVQLPRLAGAVAMLGSSSRNGCSAPFALQMAFPGNYSPVCGGVTRVERVETFQAR